MQMPWAAGEHGRVPEAVDFFSGIGRAVGGMRGGAEREDQEAGGECIQDWSLHDGFKFLRAKGLLAAIIAGEPPLRSLISNAAAPRARIFDLPPRRKAGMVSPVISRQGKILVIRGGAIGDFILTLPAL